jgi:outer membrane PBP1 activator LpoA protein
VQQVLQNDKPEQAADLLLKINVDDSAPALQDAFFRLSALTYNRQGEFHAASEALMVIRSPLPTDASIIRETCLALGEIACFVQSQLIVQQGNDNYLQQQQDKLWLELLNAAEPTALELPSLASQGTYRLGEQLTKIPTSSAKAAKIQRFSQGWRDLRVTIASAGSVAQAQRAWQRWQARNPDHPATRQPPTFLRQLDNFSTPKVSVLLPLSGRLSTIANAIRDGVMTGYFEDLDLLQGANSKPVNVAFIDSSSQDAASLFNQTLKNRSDVIVGPLIKAKAAALMEIQQNTASAAPKPQPSLVLLNQIADSSASRNNPNVYQFAAAIEDEAITLAEHLRSQGHLRLMVVTNGEIWSQRAKKALTETWQGPLVEADFQQTKEITDVVGLAMGVADSQRRREYLAKRINEEVEFLPRGRKDLDAVVTFTNSLESKALIPALKFHFAENLRVYGTSQTARGSDLKELATFQVTELPMLAQPQELTERMTSTLQLKDRSLIELYALGLDGYRLATWAHWLKNNSAVLPENKVIQLQFASGHLALGLSGRIHRKLVITTIDQTNKNRRIKKS